jgi:hypothetical protein
MAVPKTTNEVEDDMTYMKCCICSNPATTTTRSKSGRWFNACPVHEVEVARMTQEENKVAGPCNRTIVEDVGVSWVRSSNTKLNRFVPSMQSLNLDTPRDVEKLQWFLANAWTWRGPVAKRIKKELRRMIGPGHIAVDRRPVRPLSEMLDYIRSRGLTVGDLNADTPEGFAELKALLPKLRGIKFLIVKNDLQHFLKRCAAEITRGLEAERSRELYTLSLIPRRATTE